MKISKLILFLFLSAFVGGLNSCIIVHRQDNGKHKGWYKNSNNPHHPGRHHAKPGKHSR